MGIALIKAPEEEWILEPRSYRAIDADAHIIEGEELFSAYLPESVRSRAPGLQPNPQGARRFFFDGVEHPPFPRRLMAPKGTPREVVALVQSTLAKAAQRPEAKARFAQMDFQPVVNTPEEFAAEWKAELNTWERLIKSRDIRID